MNLNETSELYFLFLLISLRTESRVDRYLKAEQRLAVIRIEQLRTRPLPSCSKLKVKKITWETCETISFVFYSYKIPRMAVLDSEVDKRTAVSTNCLCFSASFYSTHLT